MKPILLIINTPPPFHGSSLMNSFLIDYLKTNNYSYIHAPVVKNKDNKSLGKFSFFKVFNAFAVYFKLFKYYRNYKIVYLVMSVDGYAFYRHCLIVIIAKLLRKKIVLHLRGKGFIQKKGFGLILNKFVFRNAYLIQHSKLLKYDIEKFTNYKKLFIVPNGWPDCYEKYKSQKLDDKQTFDVIFLSNLIIEKGLFVLLESIKEILKLNYKIKFHFVGDWPSAEIKNSFYNFINIYKLDDIIGHVGPLFNDEKYKFLINMDLLVFPTFYKLETWGNVNLEAMMFNLPVISTNEASIPEIIDNDLTGFIIEKENPKELGEKIIWMYNNQDAAKKMGAAGREKYLKLYTINVFEQNMKNVFLDVSK